MHNEAMHGEAMHGEAMHGEAMHGELRSRPGREPVTGATTVGTVLGIWAHPDDEAYLMAGLMATATAAG